MTSLLAIFCLGAAAHAPSSAPAQSVPAKVELTLSAKTAAPGAAVKGVVKITFSEGLHAYHNPPSKDYMIPLLVVSKTKEVKLTRVAYPKGIGRKSAGEKEDVMVYEGTIEVPVVLLMPKKPGPVNVKLAVSYQQCTETDCYPPEEAVVGQRIVVGGPAK